MTRLSRRETLRLVSVGAAAALLAACQTAAGPSSGPASTRPEQARPGGRLRIGRSDDLVTTDGMFFQSNTLGTTYGTVYERLIDYDDQLNPLPMLAASWQFS